MAKAAPTKNGKITQNAKTVTKAPITQAAAKTVAKAPAKAPAKTPAKPTLKTPAKKR